MHLLLAELAKFSVQWHNGIRGLRRASNGSLSLHCSALSTRKKKKDSRMCLKAWSLRTGQFTQVSKRHAVELLLNSSESECKRRKRRFDCFDPAQKHNSPGHGAADHFCGQAWAHLSFEAPTVRLLERTGADYSGLCGLIAGPVAASLRHRAGRRILTELP